MLCQEVTLETAIPYLMSPQTVALVSITIALGSWSRQQGWQGKSESGLQVTGLRTNS